MALSYQEGKKLVYKGLVLLGVITIIEVLIALLGNGHIIAGFHLSKWIMYPAMIGLSMYKAYFIVANFMHLGFELKSLALTVLLPLLLLVWGIIAFLQEGNDWARARAQIEMLNANGYEEVLLPKDESHYQTYKAKQLPSAENDTEKNKTAQ